MALRDKPHSTFPQEKIELAEKYIRQGLSLREVCRRIGTHHHNIRPIIARLAAAGEVPADCPCGLPRGRGHFGKRCPYSSQERSRLVRKDRVHLLPWSVINDVRARVEQGQSDRSIARETGLALQTVQRHRRIYLERRGEPLPPCECGRPARHPGGCIVNSPSVLSRDRIRRIERWAREGLSAAEMQRRSRAVTNGSGLEAILKYATPVWEQMAREGIVCGCGERLGHRGLCAATWETPGRTRGPRPIPPEEERRIANALLNGDPVPTISRNVRVSEKKVLRVLRAMSDEDRRQRSSLVRQRIGDAAERRHGEDLLSQVHAALPAGIDAALRDDIAAELCLAVLQGDLTIDRIKARADAFIVKAYRTWANAFGPRSLDEALGEDDDRDLHDIFGDDTTLTSIDDLVIGGPPT